MNTKAGHSHITICNITHHLSLDGSPLSSFYAIMNQRPPPWSASDRSSFAYESTKTRWPKILTGVINHLNQLIHPLLPNDPNDALRIGEAKRLINQVGELLYRISHDRVVEPIPDDGEINVDIYNSELERLRQAGVDTWFKGPWLFLESYMYRLLRHYFNQTKTWRNLDPFSEQKNLTLRSSGASVFRLSSALQDIIDNRDKKSDLKATFLTLAHGSLWGNATDLSLLTNITQEQVQKLQATREDETEKILQNDLMSAWEHLETLDNATIDIILDNAGFELYTDLVLMDWLITCTPYVGRVIIHPKTVPWFVSDVLPHDFDFLFEALASETFFAEDASDANSRSTLQKTLARWRAHITDGNWCLSVPRGSSIGQQLPLRDFGRDGVKSLAPTSKWWTNPLPFWEIADRADSDVVSRVLLSHFRKSGLTIWKGDLNYRRLTGDLRWSSTTPFTEAIGSLAGQFPILALRTCKADVVVGLNPGKAEELDGKDPQWRVSGQYAVVSFVGRKE